MDDLVAFANDDLARCRHASGDFAPRSSSQSIRSPMATADWDES